MRLLQIVGRKKSGKTGLTERLIPLLRKRGLRIGTVKHSSHPHPLDRPGSDSERHRKAGSETTMVITAASVALHFPVPDEDLEVHALVGRFLGSLDLVLIEGWARLGEAKIEVIPSDREGRPREPVHLDSGELLAVVLSPRLRSSPEVLSQVGVRLHGGHAGQLEDGSPRDAQRGVPGFYWEDAQGVADLVVRWYEDAL
ncbi:MAG: molybdopterin-guanine dinucleotide biosynthesis protein B [Candidatus Eisenbacteria sp.]|nr:molybdopterin-guanine dinucleotide biosynthesis protein B [Candidatus Eisenbacteria bacterium]